MTAGSRDDIAYLYPCPWCLPAADSPRLRPPDAPALCLLGHILPLPIFSPRPMATTPALALSVHQLGGTRRPVDGEAALMSLIQLRLATCPFGAHALWPFPLGTLILMPSHPTSNSLGITPSAQSLQATRSPSPPPRHQDVQPHPITYMSISMLPICLLQGNRHPPPDPAIMRAVTLPKIPTLSHAFGE